MKSPHPFYRPLLIVGLLLALAAVCLSFGCGDNEPQQRAAFIALLEKNILAKSGIRYAKLTEEQRKQIGPAYAEQYDLLPALHDDKEFENYFSKIFSDVQKGLRPGPSEETLPLVKAGRETLEEAGAFIQKKQQALQAKRKSFSQPEDLKAVYDKAFDQMIDTPLNAVQEAFGYTRDALAASAALHEYILQNPGSAAFSGRMLTMHDPAHEKKLQELLEDMNKKAQKTQEGVKKLNSAIR